MANKVVDNVGMPIAEKDCVEYCADIYAVMGLTELCGVDAVVLGDVMGGALEMPYLVPAHECMKIIIL